MYVPRRGIGVNFTVSSLFLTETNPVPGSKLWHLLRVNADTSLGNLRRTPNAELRRLG